jgi:hypothetical protein
VQLPRPLYSLLALLAICATAACEKVPLTSPTGSTITLTVDKTSVPIGGTATLTAVVTEASGTAPQNGTMVTFNGAFGTITPQEAPTVGGIARATFTGTASGLAKVGAFSGPAKATEVELRVGGAAAERVTLRSEPSTLTATGGTVTIIANVQDASGTALPNTPVNFNTDGGSLSSNSVNTDASGEARVQLTTTRTAKVTAAVGSKTAEVTITAVPAPSVSVGSCTASPVVGVPMTCTITPAVTTGGALVTNVVVNWGDGTGDQNLGPITGATSVPHVYARSGAFTVSATATDANGQVGRGSTSVNVGRSLPSVTLTCPTAAMATNVAGSFSVTPQSNPPIQISNISVDFGDGTSRNLGTPTGQTGFTKAYASEGAYTVVVTTTDVQGQRGTSSCGVVVNRSTGPAVTLTHDSAPAKAGDVEVFTVGSTGGTGAVTFRVTLQDGTVLYQGGPGSFTWTPSTAGTATITAVGTDAAGNTGNRILVLTVNP